MERTISHPRILAVHPRRPDPSYARMHATIDWLKGDLLAYADLTEDDLYKLAEQALSVAAVLRQQRLEGRG